MTSSLRRIAGIVSCALALGALSGCVAASEDGAGDDAEDLAGGLRVCATGDTVEGLDVSYYQETINWNGVKQSGREFAFIRVSDGTKHPDTRFSTNWAGAAEAGLLRGAYQFFRPAQSAEAQADLVVNALGQLGPGDLPAVIDVETADGQSSKTLVSKIKTWLARVEAGTGKKPIIYAASGFWNSLTGTSELAAYPLWVANYGAKCPSMPNTWSQWQFWQYSDSGKVAGVSGSVDVNVFNGTLAELQAFAGINNFSALDVGWERLADGSYTFESSAPDAVERVDYFVDGYAVGSAKRSEGDAFIAGYTFSIEKEERRFEARGFDSGGQQVAKGIGLLDVTAGTGVFIRQTGDRRYEIGLERAPADVAAVEVSADEYLLVDGVTGAARSERLAVESDFNQLGERSFAISTFNADGSLRGTLHRTFTLE